MTATTTTTAPPQQRMESTLAALVERALSFDGPAEGLLALLIAEHCRAGAARQGAVLRRDGGEGVPELLLLFPPQQGPGGEASRQAPAWVAAAQEAIKAGAVTEKTAVVPLHRTDGMYGQAASFTVLVPLRLAGAAAPVAVAAFLCDRIEDAQFRHNVERLDLTGKLLTLYEMRAGFARQMGSMAQLRQAATVLAAAGEHKRFKAAAMALVNQIASLWQGERVSLGLLRGRYVKLVAVSHTEKIVRKTKLVQCIESAMEECLDQDLEVIFPAGADATFISRDAGELSRLYGSLTVCSLPLRRGDKLVGAITIERPAAKPFTVDEIEALRLVCELTTPMVAQLAEHDKWIGAKTADGVKKCLTVAVGPRYTWVKAAAVGVCLAIVLLLFVKKTDWVTGQFELQPSERRVVAVPFDQAVLDEVLVRPGDKVQKGDVLARLKTDALVRQRSSSLADKVEAEKKRDIAQRDGKTADMQVAQAQADKAQADIGLLDWRIDQANIRAPIDGTVLPGSFAHGVDLRTMQDTTLQVGQELFKIAALQNLIAEVRVPESRIADVTLDQKGMIAPRSRPGQYIQVQVTQITPMAEVLKDENIYRVKVKLTEDQSNLHLQAGTEGLARLDSGRKPIGFLWTRDLIDWVRMKLWI